MVAAVAAAVGTVGVEELVAAAVVAAVAAAVVTGGFEELVAAAVADAVVSVGLVLPLPLLNSEGVFFDGII